MWAMGWADCGTDANGRVMGYAWTALCDEKDCDEVIDRGLGYCCGGMHEGVTVFDHDGKRSFTTCGGYYCPNHLRTSLVGFDHQDQEVVLTVCSGCSIKSVAEIGDYSEWPDSYTSPEGDEVVVAGEIGE